VRKAADADALLEDYEATYPGSVLAERGHPTAAYRSRP
jgi:hypothetical protein